MADSKKATEPLPQSSDIYPGPILTAEPEHDLPPGEVPKGTEVHSNDPSTGVTLESGVHHFYARNGASGFARVHPGVITEEQKAEWDSSQSERIEGTDAAKGQGGKDVPTGPSNL